MGLRGGPRAGHDRSHRPGSSQTLFNVPDQLADTRGEYNVPRTNKSDEPTRAKAYQCRHLSA